MSSKRECLLLFSSRYHQLEYEWLFVKLEMSINNGVQLNVWINKIILVLKFIIFHYKTDQVLLKDWLQTFFFFFDILLKSVVSQTTFLINCYLMAIYKHDLLVSSCTVLCCITVCNRYYNYYSVLPRIYTSHNLAFFCTACGEHLYVIYGCLLVSYIYHLEHSQ